MVILGLGTNLGDRAQQLAQAVAQLRKILSGLVYSKVYECRALLPEAAPPEWDIPFLNMAVMGECDLEPRELLAHLQELERALGRGVHAHWSPREIDIDMLSWDDRLIAEPGLIVPHLSLTERDFAMLPLRDLAPEWLYPGEGAFHGKTAREIVALAGFALPIVDVKLS